MTRIISLIFYFQLLLWMLPPLKQYKGGLFYYFLILAITDPAVYIAFKYLKIDWSSSYMVFYFFQTLSVLYYSRKFNIRWFSVCLVILVSTFYFLHPYSMLFPLVLLHLIMVYHLLSILLFEILKTLKINMYYFVILFYEFTIILKCLALIYSFCAAVYYFYIITAIEILFCLYFIFFNANNSIEFKLKHS